MGETIERVLSKNPGLKARVLAVAEVTGQSIPEIIEECAVLWLNDMIADEAYGAAEHARMERRDVGLCPLGMLQRGAIRFLFAQPLSHRQCSYSGP